MLDVSLLFMCSFDTINTYACMVYFATRFLRCSYITDLMQEIGDQGGVINCSLIRGDWLEIDTSEDYIVASKFNFSEDGG